MRFTHLQVHSHFTLLGSTANVSDLAARAAAEGMTHLALTDTNALYGAVAFERACRSVGIQPILGMTLTVAPPAGQMGPATFSGRLVLLAMNQIGFRSLCRLSSHIQGQPEREALATQGLSWEELEAHRDGLLCLSGGRGGWVEHLLRAGDRQAAGRYADRLADIYGKDAYLSVELHRPGDRAIVEEIVALGQRRRLAAVAVQPVYCLSPQEVPRLRLLAAIDRNVPLRAVPPSALPAHGDPKVDLHWLRRDEVEARFASFPKELASVEEIVNRCGQALPSGEPIWPELKLPRGRASQGDETPDQALAMLAREGLEKKYGPEALPPVRERLDRELAAIAGYGYTPLFLVVADIVRFARRHSVPVNTRGSVANSLVAYCAGITNVDPIAHGLFFERFLNPARADLPDIDLDFCSRRRDEVLEYVRRTYGADRVALVSTVSTLQPRGAVRETAKAYGLDEAQTKHLIALLPRGWRRMPSPDAQPRDDVEGVLAALESPRLRQIVQAAYGLVGQPHHLSVHPGGVVITPGPLTDVVPVQWAPKGFLITQFSHGDVEAIGLPKIDLLGIRALTVLAEAERLTRRHHDPAFSLSDIPLDDPRTAQMLSRGETIGVFQCESAGAQRTLRQLQARTVQDLAVANAFFKPGPATGGMARTFVRRYRGEEPVAFLHPALAPILEGTQGVLLFQEQVLRIACEIAGLDWEQADQLRRGMSHFGHEEMAEMQAHFVQGCQRSPPDGPGFRAQQAETLWEQVLAFAGYGFNQGHATSYAVVSYRSAYLKAHWPAAFLCARLAERGGFHHPAIYIAEAARLGLTVRPPHVNHSDRQFTLGWEGDQGVLWMGLGQIRDLRRASVRSIVAERSRQPFSGLRDLLERVPLVQKETVHLIQCGALDGLGESRAALLAEAGQVEQAGSTRQMVFAFAKPQIVPESPARRLSWEQRLLGQPVSVHPLDLVADQLQGYTALRQLPAAESPRQWVTTAGVRLPGWTGGQGFFLGDGETFVIVRGEPDQQAPPPWQPLLVAGRWLGDEWGTFWLQAEGIEPIELS
jgi:DNA-directed DNA polymerase III PolC